jgi:hypothetical protein
VIGLHIATGIIILSLCFAVFILFRAYQMLKFILNDFMDHVITKIDEIENKEEKLSERMDILEYLHKK